LATHTEQNLTKQFESRAVAIARSLASSGTEVLLFRDLSTIQSMIDQFLDIEGVAYVLVVDNQGNVLAHTFVPDTPPELRNLKGHSLQTTVEQVTVNGLGDFINVTSPILDKEMGHVHVGMNRQLIRDAVWRAVTRQTILMCLLFPLGAWA